MLDYSLLETRAKHLNEIKLTQNLSLGIPIIQLNWKTPFIEIQLSNQFC